MIRAELASWQADMADVERLSIDIKNEEAGEAGEALAVFKLSHTGDGLRYRIQRLKATSSDPIERKSGVQHKPAARVARSKLRSCKECCCPDHCLIATHGPKIAINVPVKDDDAKYILVNMLDRSWMSLEELKVDMMDSFTEQSQEFMGMLTSVNTDLDGVSLDTLDLLPQL